MLSVKAEAPVTRFKIYIFVIYEYRLKTNAFITNSLCILFLLTLIDRADSDHISEVEARSGMHKE